MTLVEEIFAQAWARNLADARRREAAAVKAYLRSFFMQPSNYAVEVSTCKIRSEASAKHLTYEEIASIARHEGFVNPNWDTVALPAIPYETPRTSKRI